MEAIPVDTECADFPWRNGAVGAAGIGRLTADGGAAFVPSLEKESDFLQCNVTLLDDVMLDVEVFFATPGDPAKTVSLTEVQKRGGTLDLVCVPREPGDVPPGCRPPGPGG